MYSRQQAQDFWFEFDEKALYRRSPAFDSALSGIFRALPGPPLTNVVDMFRGAMASGTYPARFQADVAPAGPHFVALSNAQQAVFAAHFAADGDAIRSAFIDFGQGVLFNPRRAADPTYTGHLIHMMDGSPSNWVGYHRWHAFLRAQQLSGADQIFWDHIATCIAIAWSVQTEANPVIDSPDNPGLHSDRVAEHVAHWTALTQLEIDQRFATYPYEAPPIPAGGSRLMRLAGAVDLQLGRFAQVQDILNTATAGGKPIHGGGGAFWNQPLADFLSMSPVYGVPLIAEPGPSRGARSGLIQALRGIGRFGPGGFPRMPLNRPPVAPEDIEFIERWIDDNCPEF